MSLKKLVKHLKIDTLCGALDAMKLRAGEHIRSFSTETTNDNMFKGIDLTRVDGDTISYETIKSERISSSEKHCNKDFLISKIILSSV